MSAPEPTRYKGVDAWRLADGGDLEIVVVPTHGAKIASLTHRAFGELLQQGPDPSQMLPARLDDDYQAGECAGIDEMCPTVDAATLSDGTQLADHGEVWALPWTCAVDGVTLRTEVDGVRLGYRLVRELRLEDGGLEARYRLSNPTTEPLPLLWAWHPLFVAAPGMRIVAPPGDHHVIGTCAGPLLGKAAGRQAWPIAHGAAGPIDLSVIGARDDHGYFKVWFDGPVDLGWCGLHDPARDLAIVLEWDATVAPYLGLWCNLGGIAGQYVIAPEPATAPFDSPSAAAAAGHVARLEPGTTWDWSVRLSVTRGRPEPASQLRNAR